MNYCEQLPEGCPPAEAEEVTAKQDVFRLVRTDPPSSDDFRSQRAEKPGVTFPGISECHAKGLSVFVERTDCEKLLKLRHMRNRRICRIHLDAGAGRIQQTFQPTHHTWWPLEEFAILSHCNVEAV
jgi:hypothetical protein